MANDDAAPEVELQFTAGRTLTEQVVRELRRQIILGRLRPGQPLVEMRLAAQLQVSRSTVREALTRLKSQGLLEVAPHRTHRVSRFDVADAREICDVLALLEAHGARRLALPLHDSVVAELEDVIARMGRLRFPSEIEEFTELDRAFHGALLRAGGHRRLTAVWEDLGPLLGVLMATTMPTITTTGPRIAARHRLMLRAAAACDAERLAEVITEHYKFTVEQKARRPRRRRSG
jgi:GntR family transcriptional regulator, rspAB operon transcriptional repressor